MAKAVPTPGKHGGARPNSGRPDLGKEGLKRGGKPVNTILYPVQKAFVERFAAEHHITQSEAFREIVARYMELYDRKGE